MFSHSWGLASRNCALAVVFTLAFGALLACQSQPAAPATPAAAATQATKAPPAPAAPTQAPAPASQVPQAQAQPTKAPAVTQETLKIGLSTMVTGSGARMGMNIERFQRMAIEDVNAKGGLKVGGKSYRLEAITVDDKGTSDGGRDAANKLVLADKVRLLMVSASAPIAGAQVVTEANKVLLMGAAPSDKSLGTSFPLTLSNSSGTQTMAIGALLDWLKEERPNAKRVAIMQADDVTGRGLADAVEAGAPSRGLTVVAKEFYPLEAKDFAPLVTRVLRQSPDVISADAGTKAPLWIELVKELRTQGFNGTLISRSAPSETMREAPTWLAGLTVNMLFDHQAPVVPAAAKEVIQRYVQKYSVADLEPLTYQNYTVPFVLAQALEKAGTVDDTEKIAKTLRDGEWETLWTKEIGKSRYVGAKTLGLASVLENANFLTKIENAKAITFKMVKGTLP